MFSGALVDIDKERYGGAVVEICLWVVCLVYAAVYATKLDAALARKASQGL